MSRSYYGNLALMPQETREPKPRTPKKRKVTIHYALPLKEKLAYLLLLGAVVIVAGLILSRYALIAEENYQIEKIKQEITDIQKENELLRLQIAESSSPERILKIAKEMGLTKQDGNVATVKIAGTEN